MRYWLQRHQYPQRYAHFNGLLQNQALDRATVLARQRHAFADMVRFAAGHTVYYAHRLDRLDDWDETPEALPILTKEDVRSHLDALLASDVDRNRVKLGYTGGSTGQPLAFWYDEAKHELMRAGMMRGFMMSGWRPGQKVLHFWGARQDTGRGGVFGHRLADAVAGERTIAALEYTEASLHAWAMRIRQWRPTLLYGYASALGELARYIVDQGLAMPASLVGVYSTAETLHDEQRQRMQQAFNCKVFNQYGCREVPNIAWECRHDRMHVMADLVHLESVSMEGGDRLLVTSLTNRLMPFIRYDLGDSGRLLEGECDCGSPFPLMEMGMCRQNDLIRMPPGKRVHPAFFNRLLYGLTQIRHYQWVQTAPDCIALNLVCPEKLDAHTITSLSESIRRELGEGVRLEVNHVDEIRRTASGKHRFVVGLD